MILRCVSLAKQDKKWEDEETESHCYTLVYDYLLPIIFKVIWFFMYIYRIYKTSRSFTFELFELYNKNSLVRACVLHKSEREIEREKIRRIAYF